MMMMKMMVIPRGCGVCGCGTCGCGRCFIFILIGRVKLGLGAQTQETEANISCKHSPCWNDPICTEKLKQGSGPDARSCGSTQGRVLWQLSLQLDAHSVGNELDHELVEGCRVHCRSHYGKVPELCCAVHGHSPQLWVSAIHCPGILNSRHDAFDTLIISQWFVDTGCKGSRDGACHGLARPVFAQHTSDSGRYVDLQALGQSVRDKRNKKVIAFQQRRRENQIRYNVHKSGHFEQ